MTSLKSAILGIIFL